MRYRCAANGDFNFTLEQLGVPVSARSTDDALPNNFLKAGQTLCTRYRRYSDAEIPACHHYLDSMYSYVNGSDITRGYTKPFVRSWMCWRLVAAAQLLWGELQWHRDSDVAGQRVSKGTFARYVSELFFHEADEPCSMVRLLSDVGAEKDAVTQVETSLWWAMSHDSGADHGEAAAEVPAPFALANIGFLRAVGAECDTVWMYAIDTDSDELRHSMRGLLEHTRLWSRGRVTAVSPYSNVPLWPNQSINFFLRSLYASSLMRGETESDGERRESHALSRQRRLLRCALRATRRLHYTRVYVVDQRALMPSAPIITVNSYVIKPFVFCLHDVSGVSVNMNDDYFVMKDVDVSDMVNSFGGPVL